MEREDIRPLSESGLPIEVDEKDYPKMRFGRKEMAPPLGRSNPEYWQLIISSSAMMIFGGIILMIYFPAR